MTTHQPTDPRPSGAKKRTTWWAAGAVILIVVAIFVAPGIIRNLKAPAISESFGIEDAVVALRLDARDTSYLVLVNEEGDTRSAKLDERGFENSGIAWSDAGLSTGGPHDEYLLHDDGLVTMPLTLSNDSLSERTRLVTDDSFLVATGSAEGSELGFIDAASGEMTTVDPGQGSFELAACDGEPVMVTESGVETVTADTTDFSAALGLFDDVVTLVCDGDSVYGFGEINDGKRALQKLYVWDRTTGERTERIIRYPGEQFAWTTATPFVHGERLYWAADWHLWSIPLPENDPSVPASLPIEAEEAASLGYEGGLDIVAGTSEGTLAHAGGTVFAVAADEKLVKPARAGESYDRLESMTIAAIDVETGERRAAIELDGIDFPERDVSVHAIAVNPAWAEAQANG